MELKGLRLEHGIERALKDLAVEQVFASWIGLYGWREPFGVA